MSAEVGSRALVIPAAVIAMAALALASCKSDELGGSPTRRIDAGSVDAGSVGTGPLGLVAVGGPAGSVMAQVFFNEPGVGQQPTCAAPMNAGACQLTSCQEFGAVGDPAAGYDNFGPISATAGTTTVALEYMGFGYPSVDFPASVALETGAAMRFHGGDGVSAPVFDVTVTIPGLAVLTSPVTGGNATASVNASQDLSVTWVPISIGQIDFEITGALPTGGDTVLSILCTFDGASGSGIVPQGLLSALKAMAGTYPLTGRLTSELDGTTLVGGFTIETIGYQISPTTGQAFNVTLQ